MRKYEIHKAMYHYGLVLRGLDILFSSKRKYSKVWVSPNQGFDVYRSAGGDIPQMSNEARASGLGGRDSLQITCAGVLLKPVGWKDGYSVGVPRYQEKDKETKIRLYLEHPGICDIGYGMSWAFSMIISPTRTVIKPILQFPRHTQESQEQLLLFGDKKFVVI